jgi:hypothetical protein
VEVARVARHAVEPVLCTMSGIDGAIRRFYRGEDDGRSTQPAGHSAAVDEGVWEEAEADLVESGKLASGQVPIPEGPGGEAAQVRAILLRLEKTVAAQGKSFRVLVELLQEKGLLRRGELGSRTSRKA